MTRLSPSPVAVDLATLPEIIGGMLCADPICGGRVSTGTIKALCDLVALAASDRDVLVGALTDARNNILSLLGGFRDDMPDAAVKLFQAQARQIDAALIPLAGEL